MQALAGDVYLRKATVDYHASARLDDLLDIDGIDEERAGKLIMAARAHWFE